VFETLTQSLQGIFGRLFRRGVLTERNIEDGLREVRRALLAADVNYRVVRDFIERVKQKAIGQQIIKGVRPDQQFIKIIHDELVALMGPSFEGLTLKDGDVSVVMMVGLQGGGKTTSCAKLASYLHRNGRRPLLVAADIRRPAAIEQLQTLGRQLGVEVFTELGLPAEQICADAKGHAQMVGLDVVILDTAGRLHIDEELMEELSRIKEVVAPDEILFVADAMTGQDAVNSAKAFDERLSITGVILTKMDGDARGGAAMSIKAVTGKPIKFIGTGEHLEKWEEFHPDRIASRILGMGDVVTLVERAQEAMTQEEAARLQKKLLEERFTFGDFLKQLQMVKRMGGLKDMLSMLPGVGAQLSQMEMDERELVHVEAMILSMTPEEREQPELVINSMSRRVRIARGSGVSVKDVNELCKQFEQMRKIVRQFKKAGFFGRLKLALGWGKKADELVIKAEDEDEIRRLREKKRKERKKKRKLLKKQRRRSR